MVATYEDVVANYEEAAENLKPRTKNLRLYRGKPPAETKPLQKIKKYKMLNIPKNPNESGNRIPDSPVFPKKNTTNRFLKVTITVYDNWSKFQKDLFFSVNILSKHSHKCSQ